jgi:hypothetical protein
VHNCLISFIAGEMNERNLSASDAIIAVHAQFKADPQGAAENADMLVGFDPATVSVDEIEQIIHRANAHKNVDRILGIR